MQPAATTDRGGRRHRILLVLAVIIGMLLVLGIVGSAVFSRAPEFHATAYEPPAPAADLTLTDHTGATLSLDALRGTTVLLFFGYTHCPDVCPLTLAQLTTALREAGDAAEDARVLLITVDPARDTPEVLAAYVRNFGPHITGLTGTHEQIRAVMQAYGIHAEPSHGEPGVLGHTSAVFGIDRSGMIRVLLRPDAPAEQLTADVRTLLRL
jgi:protein SCO1